MDGRLCGQLGCGSLAGGVAVGSLFTERGFLFGGGGVSVKGGLCPLVTSLCVRQLHPPCGQNDRRVKALPCPKLRLRAVNIFYLIDLRIENK